MLPPSELKKRQFSRALRGYSTVEVDEHLSFILEKYTELYRQNDELEKQISKMETELSMLKSNEDAIRRAMVNAQREERKVIDEANDRANLILRTAKLNTDRMISEFKTKIREERVTLYKLRKAVTEFKENTLRQYQMHLEFLQQISPDLPLGNDPELEMTEDDYANSLLEQMKLDIESSEEESTKDVSVETPSFVKRKRMPDLPEDQKMRTAIFDTVKKQKSNISNAKTKEIPIVKK